MPKIVGNALKSEREKRGISLEKIAGETNLSLRYLKALEEEELQVLPADFYAKYYIKAYLRCIGADETVFFLQYHSHIKSFFKKSKPVTIENFFENVRYAKFRKRGFFFLAASILAAAAFIILARPWRWIEKKDPAFVVQMTQDSMPYYLPPDGFSPDFNPVNVSITVNERCWIRADRGGEKVLEKVYQKGESLNLGGYRLTLMIGNPQAVMMKINGRELSSFKTGSEPLKLVLTPSTLPDIFK